MASFAACEQKARQEFFLSFVPRESNIHLNTGSAFAKGIEVFRRSYYDPKSSAKGDFERARLSGFYALTHAFGLHEREPADDEPKSHCGISAAFESYIHHYHPSKDYLRPYVHEGVPVIEFSFVLPIDVPHPESGEPLLYSGRFDTAAELHSSIFGVDEKTTTFSLTERWRKQWDLRSQFTGYCWGARAFGLPVAGVIVRGTSIQKTQITHGEAITYRPQWMIDLWYENLLSRVRRMIHAWEISTFEYNFADACTSYGGCPFVKVCSANPQNRDRIYEAEFKRSVWDPAAHTRSEET